MSKLIISIASTVDGVIDGFEWYVTEGEHDQAEAPPGQSDEVGDERLAPRPGA